MSAPTNYLGKAVSGTVSTSLTTVYTAPATAAGWVEARILVTNTTGVAATLTCSIGGTACGWSTTTIPANANDEIRCFLAPSETLALQAGTASALAYRLTLSEVS